MSRFITNYTNALKRNLEYNNNIVRLEEVEPHADSDSDVKVRCIYCSTGKVSSESLLVLSVSIRDKKKYVRTAVSPTSPNPGCQGRQSTRD